MKYYSDELKKFFDTEKECVEAEETAAKAAAEAQAKAEELKAARKERAQEVEDAYKAIREAQKKYSELLRNFVKDYGSYHFSYTEKNPNDWFFSFWDM